MHARSSNCLLGKGLEYPPLERLGGCTADGIVSGQGGQKTA
jgi:hypothetical protein